MKGHLLEILAAALLLGSMALFARCVFYVDDHEYLGAALVLGAGVSLVHVGAELARLALVARD